MADWEDDNFDVDAGFTKPSRGDKWEGEDEDEDVKDSWDVDSEEEEKPEENNTEVKAIQVKKKRSVKDAIKEKEERERREREERAEREEEERRRLEEMTPEEKAAEEAAEKLRQQRIVEESDFELAKETFGVPDDPTRLTLDSMNPSSKEEFDKYCKLLTDKLYKFDKSPHYVNFLENLFRDCCLGLEADDVKKLGTTLTVLASEKAKVNKAKGKTKKKKGAQIKAAKKDELEDYSQYDEYDDFM
ncbi:eukaryotic translation initiation factor 3 subunit J-like [Ptychodera flava]|uniref:eukaryotic translation initiation factor 3 subunit J-like n=1 Tax=Ptychodera flava TaxID=63121 RepID=UPI00396A7CE9